MQSISLLLPNDSTKQVLPAVQALIRPLSCPTPLCTSHFVQPELPIGRALASVYFAHRSDLETRTSVNLIHPIAAPHSESTGYSCRAAHTPCWPPYFARRHPASTVHPCVRHLVSPPPVHRRRPSAGSCSELARCLALSAGVAAAGLPASKPSRIAIANSGHTSSPSLSRPSLLSEAKLCALPHHTTPYTSTPDSPLYIRPRPDKSASDSSCAPRGGKFSRPPSHHELGAISTDTSK